MNIRSKPPPRILWEEVKVYKLTTSGQLSVHCTIAFGLIPAAASNFFPRKKLWYTISNSRETKQHTAQELGQNFTVGGKCRKKQVNNHYCNVPAISHSCTDTDFREYNIGADLQTVTTLLTFTKSSILGKPIFLTAMSYRDMMNNPVQWFERYQKKKPQILLGLFNP